MKRLIEQYQSEYLSRARVMATNVENMISGRRADASDVEARFQALVQSPLRAAILRFLCARPDESFDLESLMQTFGRMRLDVENCIRELAGFGLAQRDRRQPGPAAVRLRAARRATRSATCSTTSSSAAPPSATRTARPPSSASAK